ncbi:MAG TPA: TlpA disulfide reductase family protein, partial [Balneolaceae bacterium]
SIARAEFPLSVDVSGYAQPYDSLLSSYLTREQTLLNKISEQLSDFRQGNSTEVLQLYKKRYELAQSHFLDTPLKGVALAAAGDYLVKRLEWIEHNRDEANFDAQKARQDILQEAKKLNFFSFQSLYAQPSGSRDFTNAFANTFGVADKIEEKLGQDLMQYDIKRLGYSTLDSARTSVLNHIEGRRAKAYTKMHLIAERIGEMPLEVSTPSYRQFLKEYKDFPRYTSFLKSFYNRIKQVSPGQPAIPFSLPNKKGEIIQMKDFRGKYVLLDFWAGWCIPCLDEFDDMKEIYARYSRDEFEIVAISIEEDSLRWRKSLKRFDNPWPQLYGGNGFQQQTFRAYRGGGIPFYILIGPEGNIIRYNDVRPSFNLPAVLDSLIDTSNNEK